MNINVMLFVYVKRISMRIKNLLLKLDFAQDGKPIMAKPKSVYIALNKPVGITSTSEKNVKGNIVEFVNHPQRISNWTTI